VREFDRICPVLGELGHGEFSQVVLGLEEFGLVVFSQGEFGQVQFSLGELSLEVFNLLSKSKTVKVTGIQ